MVFFWHRAERAGSNATHTSTDYPCQELSVSSHANMSPAASSSARKGGSQDNKSPQGFMCLAGGTWSCWDGWLALARDKSLSARGGGIEKKGEIETDKERKKQVISTAYRCGAGKGPSGLIWLTPVCATNSSNHPFPARWPFCFLLPWSW